MTNSPDTIPGQRPPGRPRKTSSRLRLDLRVTPAQRRRWERAANAEGLHLGAWMKRLAEQATERRG